MKDPVRMKIADIFDKHGDSIDAAIDSLPNKNISEPTAQAKHNRQCAIQCGSYEKLEIDIINELWRIRHLEKDLQPLKKYLLQPFFSELEEVFTAGGNAKNDDSKLWQAAHGMMSAKLQAIR